MDVTARMVGRQIPPRTWHPRPEPTRFFISPMFALTKWYLDLVTDDGLALVAYSARLRWGPLRLGYSALLRSAPGQAPLDTASIRRSEVPHLDLDLIAWRSIPLGLVGSWHREAAPIDATLLETADGEIRWNCRMPRARARVTCGTETWLGRGYAETLRLTIVPNRLPFRILRWGRHLSDRHAVVWIEWEGDSCRRWVWLDGVEQPGARLTPTGLDLGDGRTVRFAESRDLRNRPVGAGLSPVAPPVRRRLVGSLGGMREHKLLSRSTLISADGGPMDAGWAIHEEVIW